LKKQYIIATAGFVLVVLLFIFGRTTDTKKPLPVSEQKVENQFNIQDYINDRVKELSSPAKSKLDSIQSGVSDKHARDTELANFWKDSSRAYAAYLFYNGEAAKLDNSEKSLTFAAQIFLEALRMEHDDAMRSWETSEAIDLFKRAIQLNPQSDDLRLGLGSCYIYGSNGSGNGQDAMKGIQEILTVANKDTSNMKAQMLLGVGGMVSGQYDKAIERLNRVISHEPGNLEAMVYLADANAAAGNKQEAIKWYKISKRLANNPHYSEEVDKRIKSLE